MCKELRLNRKKKFKQLSIFEPLNVRIIESFA